MKAVNEIVRCKCCGAVMETVCAGNQSDCADASLETMRINTQDGATEKHLPVVEEKDGGIVVKVGSLPHPMVEDHYIQWIEVIDGAEVRRKHLFPDEPPEVFFDMKLHPGAVVRAYCNKHGLWVK